MRKRFSMVAVSVAVAFGVGVGIASPTSAQTYGFYASEKECLAAKGARTDLHCSLRPGSDGRRVWVLIDNR